MSSAEPSKKYHIPVSLYQLHAQPIEQLEQWASDANCIEQADVLGFLYRLRQETAAAKAQLEQRRHELAERPFDPRTEVSADARYIARRVAIHMWILFVAFPIVLVILYNLLK